MSRLEQIEQAIAALTPEEYRQIAAWFWEQDQNRWDQQLDRDSVSGKLDALFGEATEARA